MNKKRILGTLILLAALFVVVGSATASVVFGQVFAQQGHTMSFFITSVGLGDGGNLGAPARACLPPTRPAERNSRSLR